MSIFDFFFGKKPKTEQLPTMNPQQMQLLSQMLSQASNGGFDLSQNPLYQQGSNYLSRLLSNDPSAYEDFERPYLQQYEQDILPSIMNKFGGSGLLSSSGLNQTLARSAKDLSGSLASMRGNLQNNALGQALGYAQAPSSMNYNLASLGLGQRPFETVDTPGTMGFFPGLAQGAFTGLSNRLTNGLSGWGGGFKGGF